MKDCVFCKVVKKEMPAKVEYEDEDVIVFHDIQPQAPVHLLVVPKKHIPRLAEAEEVDHIILGKCQIVAAQAAQQAGIGDAFRVLNASGENAGQSVFHIHYHVVGGWDKSPKMEVEPQK